MEMKVRTPQIGQLSSRAVLADIRMCTVGKKTVPMFGYFEKTDLALIK